MGVRVEQCLLLYRVVFLRQTLIVHGTHTGAGKVRNECSPLLLLLLGRFLSHSHVALVLLKRVSTL